MDGIKGPRPNVSLPPVRTNADSTQPKPAAVPAPSSGWVQKTVTRPVAAPVAPKPAAAPVTAATSGTAGPGATSAATALPPPKNIDEAFDRLTASASGPADVRRHTDNVMAWNSKWDLVTKATQTIDFSYFSIERDSYGYAYLGALLDAQLRGVQVTGITDYAANSNGHGFTSTFRGADYMQELAQAGAKIGIYNKLGTRAESAVKDGLTYKLISSDHDKLCVADVGTPNAEGETGGRNVAGAYHQDPADNPKSWRDDSLQLKGPVTSGLVTAMRRELDGPAVTMVKPDVFNFDSHSTELLGAYSLMQTWIKSPPLSDADKAAVRADPKKREALANQLFTDAMASLKELPGIPDEVRKKPLSSGQTDNLKKWATELSNDLELKGSKAKYDTLGGYTTADVKVIDQVGAASAPNGKRYNEMAPDLFTLISGAQKEIVIQNPYVVLTEPMMEAFEAAAKRGVQITIVTNSPESTDSAITQGFFLNDWKELEARVPTARIFVATGERKFHAKAFVADGKVSGDTSYNSDLLSGMVNGEIGAVTRSEAVAQNLMGHIADDLKDPANKFKEWTIKRDAQGQPVRGADGKFVTVEGPEQDVSAKLNKRYKVVQFLCDLLTHTSPGEPLLLKDAVTPSTR